MFATLKQNTMKFDIVDLNEFSGRAAKIYSILPEKDALTLLDHFFDDNKDYYLELKEIAAKLITMGKYTGCRPQFFKEYEGAPGDGVVALYYKQMRLYCLRYDRSCIFVGSGGVKPPGIAAYQDYPPLDAKATEMKKIAASINKAIKEKDLMIQDDGTLIKTDYLELEI